MLSFVFKKAGRWMTFLKTLEFVKYYYQHENWACLKLKSYCKIPVSASFP